MARSPKTPKPKRDDPLHALDDEQRVQVFYRLIGDPGVRRQAQAFAEEILGLVSVEDVAEQVSDAIETADVDEVYAHSGRTRDGYVDPGEEARRYLEERIEPVLEDMERRLKQGRLGEAQAICMGILLGLYQHRSGGGTTDHVLGLDPDFAGEAADAAFNLYWHGKRYVAYSTRKGKRSKTGAPALPEAFWKKIPEWADMGGK